LGGGAQPLAWCIVKISVITSTLIGLSSERIEEFSVKSVNYNTIWDMLKSQAINTK